MSDDTRSDERPFDIIVFRMMVPTAAATRDYLDGDERYVSTYVTAELLARQLSFILAELEAAEAR